MRGRLRRYGIIHQQRYLDPNGFPVTLEELLLNLDNTTFKKKHDAVLATREINKSIPKDDNRAYCALLFFDVSGLRAGRD